MISVITPTTGHPRLKDAILSVQRQVEKGYRHVVVIDGAERKARTEAILHACNFDGDVVVLPRATGGGGFNGHLIYATMPFLLQAEFLALLDEDNTYAPTHLSSLLGLCRKHDLDWAYSLRSVFTDDGEAMDDDCQSLGWWPAFDAPYHLIDTSCYFVRREIFKQGATIWDRRVNAGEHKGPEFVFCEWLFTQHPRGTTTGEATMNYWLGSSQGRTQVERMNYFRAGNAINRRIYREFPWRFTTFADTKRGERVRFQCKDVALWKEIQVVVGEAVPLKLSSVSAGVLRRPVVRDGKLARGLLFLNEIDAIVKRLPELPRLFILIERRGWHGINRAEHADIKLVEDSSTVEFTRKLFPDTPLLELSNADFVDQEVFRPLGLTPEFDVIQIACWSARKRIELFIQAAALLPEVSFVHFGHFEDGGTPEELAYRDACVRRAKASGANITFPFTTNETDRGLPSTKEEINAWINRARLGVLTTSLEGHNRFKMECIAADRPVLVPSDTTTPTKKHVTPETGLFYQPTAAALAEAIRAALANPGQFRPREYLLAHAGRARAVQQLKAAVRDVCERKGEVDRFDDIDWDGRNERYVWAEKAIALLTEIVEEFRPHLR